MKNRIRRNNIKMSGVPEEIAGPDLTNLVIGVLNMCLDRSLTSTLEVDRIYREDPLFRNRLKPRDVLCTFLKDEIMRQAWKKGRLNYEVIEIQLLPDLYRWMLLTRRMLRP